MAQATITINIYNLIGNVLKSSYEDTQEESVALVYYKYFKAGTNIGLWNESESDYEEHIIQKNGIYRCTGSNDNYDYCVLVSEGKYSTTANGDEAATGTPILSTNFTSDASVNIYQIGGSIKNIMEVFFNSLGVITATDFSNANLRQGTTGLELLAYFDSIDNLNFTATLNFKRSDGKSVGNIRMNLDSENAECYKYRFSDPWFFAKAGATSLTIYLHDSNGNVTAQGQVMFNIERTDYDVDPDITVTQYNELLAALTGLASASNTILTTNSIPENIEEFTDKQKIYVKNQDINALYEKNSNEWTLLFDFNFHYTYSYGLDLVGNTLSVDTDEIASRDYVDNNYQAKLTFDDSPTEDSDNPVKSGGVYSAISSLSTTKQNKLPNASNSGKFLKSTNNSGGVAWGDGVNSIGGKTGTITTGAGLTWNGNELSVIAGEDHIYYAGTGLTLVNGDTFNVDTTTIETRSHASETYQLKLPSKVDGGYLYINPTTHAYEWKVLGVIYRFKGSVASFSNLPTNITESGFVYNCIDTGANYASVYENGSLSWDELGGIGGSTWGSISGTLSNQTDLQNALNNKQDKLPNASAAGKVLKSTNASGGVEWADETAFTGVSSLGGQTGAIILGSNLSMSGNTLNAVFSGVTSFGSETGSITVGSGLSMTGKTLSVDTSTIQAKLVFSGTGQNIKTINGVELSGNGDLTLGVKQYQNRASFPATGSDYVLYIDLATNDQYVWSTANLQYTKIVNGTAGSMSNPMTTAGDIIVGGSGGTPTRLAKGNNGELLRVDGSGNVGYGKGLPIITTAPSEANTDGLIICVLSSEPATKYSGYLYIITGSNS